MAELLSQYTIPQIILFIAALIFIVKGVQDTIDFFKNKYNQKFNKDYDAKTKEIRLEEFYEMAGEQHREVMMEMEKVSESVDSLNKRIDKLTESDMHDIKQFIVREYHYFVEQKKWIDDYSLDTILLRYADYKQEGGNSYIEMLIDEIKKLPKHP